MIGTFPLIVTGIGEFYLGWGNQLSTFNGNIIWFLKPKSEIKGLSGLFNNPNYAGLWLNLVWPFCLASIIINKKGTIGWISSLLFGFGIAITTVLTNSRAAWFGLCIGIVLIFGKQIIKIIPKLLVGIFFVFVSSFLPFLNTFYEGLFKIIIPNQSWISVEQNQITRIDIWENALKNIILNRRKDP